MTAIPSAPVDAETASLLALVHADPIHERDVATVCGGIVQVARDFGEVDPNMLRLWLHDERGNCRVHPNVIGATVQALASRGRLVFSHFTVTRFSRSGNNGRPARVWKLTSP